MRHRKLLICLFLTLFTLSFAQYGNGGKLSDLWGGLVKKYPPPKPTQAERDSLSWAYEELATTHPESAFEKEDAIDQEIVALPEPEKSTIYHKRLEPFLKLICEASTQFDVPQAVIGAVILQESSGNPKAKAKTSSAKGLMQTINATFKFAKDHLSKLGIEISNPYTPEDSISAGTWYLSYVFELAKQDYPKYSNRKPVKMWRKALEYYYAGPTWGKDPNRVVHATINGRKITIKKGWYADKVLKKAAMLQEI